MPTNPRQPMAAHVQAAIASPQRMVQPKASGSGVPAAHVQVAIAAGQGVGQAKVGGWAMGPNRGAALQVESHVAMQRAAAGPVATGGPVIQGSFLGGRPRIHAFTPSSPPSSGTHHQRMVQPKAAQAPGGHPKAGQPHGSAVHGPTVQRVGQGEAFQLPTNLTNFSGSCGQPLADPVRRNMEAFFKTSFTDVRVHLGAQASSIGALAFAHGPNLYFAPGQYNPNTPQGQQLLGHELTHVVQQRAGRVRNPFGAGIAVVQDRDMEAEADRMGSQAANALSLGRARPTPPSTSAAPPLEAPSGERAVQSKAITPPARRFSRQGVSAARAKPGPVARSEAPRPAYEDRKRLASDTIQQRSMAGPGVIQRVVGSYKAGTLAVTTKAMRDLSLSQMAIVQKLHDDQLTFYTIDQARQTATGSLSSSNPFAWDVTSLGSFATPDVGVQDVLSHFGHPTQQVVKTYDDLASRVGFDVGKNRKGVLSSSTVGDLQKLFEASKPLHVGFNPYLNAAWNKNLGNYSGGKKGIPLYSVMRSKITTDFRLQSLGNISLDDVLKAASGRPSEVHHILFKAHYGSIATTPANLMLTERSKKETDYGPGQHELMHMVATGHHKNKFKELLPQVVTEYKDWIKSQTGNKLV